MGALIVLSPDLEPWWLSGGMFEFVAERMGRVVEPDVAELLRVVAAARIGGVDLTTIRPDQLAVVLDYLATSFLDDITANPPDPHPASWDETVTHLRGLAELAGRARGPRDAPA